MRSADRGNAVRPAASSFHAAASVGSRALVFGTAFSCLLAAITFFGVACGLEEIPFIGEPNSGKVVPPSPEFINPAFQFENPPLYFSYSENYFRGYMVYYKFYLFTDITATAVKTIVTSDRTALEATIGGVSDYALTARSFRAMSRRDNVTRPLINIPEASRGSAFPIRMEFNIAETGGFLSFLETEVELTRDSNVLDYSGGQKGFGLNDFLQGDADVPVEYFTSSDPTRNLTISLFIVSYGIDTTTIQTIYSKPVFLGFANIFF